MPRSARRRDGVRVAYLVINANGPESVQLVRKVGTYPGPNYCYATSSSLLANTEITLEAEMWYDLTLEMTGETIRVYLDGELVLEAQDGMYASGVSVIYYNGSRPGDDNAPPEVWYENVTFEEP